MRNMEKSIALDNVEASWISVKGKLRIEQVVNTGDEVNGNGFIKTSNRYKEFQD